MSDRQTIKTYLREYEKDLHPTEPQAQQKDSLNELDDLLTELKISSTNKEEPPMPEYETVDALMANLSAGRAEPHQPQARVAPTREHTAPIQKAQVIVGGGANVHSNAADDLDAIVGNMNFDEDADVSVAFCQHCRGAIGSKEKQLTAFGKKYHPNHFYCNGCRAPMGFGTFYEKDGSAYCNSCFTNVLSAKCAACTTGIVSGEYLRVGERKFHPHCLTCVYCRRAIEHFYVQGNQFICDKDWLLKCAPRCGGCSNPIPHKYVSALGRDYHEDCFKCMQCSSPIHDRFFNVGGRAMCSRCDPRKLVVTHPEHHTTRPPLQTATVAVTTSSAPREPPRLASPPAQASISLSVSASKEPSFEQKRVQLSTTTTAARRTAPVDADTLKTMRKARTPEMKRHATEVATERQAAWKSMQPKPWVDSPPREGDLFETVAGYHLETGANGVPMEAIELRVERDTSLYKETMYDVDHDTYIAVNDPDEAPVIVSIDDDAVKEDSKKLYRAIVRTGKADTRVVVTCEKKKDRLKALREVIEAQKLATDEAKFKQVKKAEICDDLIEFDVKNFKNRFKFGMLYAKPDQKDEKEMFANKEGSPSFYAFLDLVAKRHTIGDWKEWKSFNAGLNNQTGNEAYYTTFQEAEVMLHVSTLLPYSAQDPQQLERKRHLGNDVVLVVFRDSPGVQLSPTIFQSHFNHVFFIVDAQGNGTYKINVSSKTGVTAHNPPLPKDGIITASALRDWFLCKAINAESKAMQSPDFSHALWRTRKLMLADIIKKYN